MAWQSRQREARSGWIGLGKAGTDGQGQLGLRAVCRGLARQSSRGKALAGWGWLWSGVVRQGKEVLVTQYIWKNGGFKIKAQVAGERLAELSEQNNHRLTPRIVLEDARPPESPLHPCFEWDDVRAAELHREDQARNVIRSIRVSQPAGNNETRIVRAYVNIVEQAGKDILHAYMPMAVVMADDALRQQLLTRARRDLLAFKDRYTEFEELAAIGENALQQIDQLELKPDAA